MSIKQVVEEEKIFQANLKALKGRYPDVHKKVLSADDGHSTTVFRLKQKDLFPNLLVGRNEERFFYYDAQNPVAHCREYIRSMGYKYAPVVVFLGFGLGYQVVSALQDFSKELRIRHLVIVEKDIEVFRAALKVLDLSQIIEHPDIQFFVGMETDELFAAFKKHLGNRRMAGYFKCLRVITMPAAHLLDGPYYQKVLESLKFSIRHTLENLGNEPYDSLLGLKHTLMNLAPTVENPWISTFKDIFESKPAIIVGAGPSLRKNMHLLKEAYHKALIVATDAALKPLLKEGIKPHLVTTIERTMITVDFYSGLKNIDDIFFVFCPLIYKETYDSFQGRKIVAHRYPEYLEWLELPVGALTGGMLVGNFAFDIAQYLGCNPIAMVGQDLSFKSVGLTHVFGNLESYRTDMTEVEGNYGNTLMTNRYFDASRRSLEMQIQEFGGLCINATEGGAKIHGALFISLREAVDRFFQDSFDYYSALDEVWDKKKPTKEDQVNHLQRVYSVVNDTITNMGAYSDQCQKGLERIQSIEGSHELIKEGKPNRACLGVIEGVTDELDEIREQIISNTDFMALGNIFSPYHTYFEMEKSALFNRFHHPEFAAVKSFLMLKEWFSTIGQLTLSTQFTMKEACPQ